MKARPEPVSVMPVHAVREWTGPGSLGFDGMSAGLQSLVMRIAAPDSGDRRVAREKIRAALRDVLGAMYRLAPEAVSLLSGSGESLRAGLPGVAPGLLPGLSISHERGMTVAAIHPYGAVGIDLMRVEELPDWEAVASDYLGAQACLRLHAIAAEGRAVAFAREWTLFEATLKCHGLALDEWTSERAASLRPRRAALLKLPQGFAGAVVCIDGAGKTGTPGLLQPLTSETMP